MTLNVTKVVEGAVPAGTTFDVQIDCDTGIVTVDGGEGGPTTQTITFDETGGTQAVSVPQFEPDCTITETADGGAETVVYAESTPTDTEFCEYTPADDSISVSFSRAQECSVAITNTFPDTLPPPPPPPPPAALPADVSRVAPAFTG